MWRLALTVLCCGLFDIILFETLRLGLLAHISIYTCLCITMNVYIRLSFHVDGKQGWKTPVRVLKTLNGSKHRSGPRSSWPYWRSGEGGRIELGLWWLWLIDSYTDAQIRDQVSFLFTAPGSLLSPYWKPCYSPRKWALLPDTGPAHTARANSIYLFIWTNFWPLPYWICPLNRSLLHPPMS